VTHSAALLLWLTNLQPREVAAFLERFDLQVHLCDAISIRFDDAAIGTLASTALFRPLKGATSKSSCVYGSGGYAWLDPMAGSFTIYYNDGSIEPLEDAGPITAILSMRRRAIWPISFSTMAIRW